MIKRIQRIIEDEGDMGITSRIRLRQIHNTSWTTSSITEGEQIDTGQKRQNQYFRDTLKLLKENDITFNMKNKEMQLNTIEGAVSLEDILWEEYKNNRRNLK